MGIKFREWHCRSDFSGINFGERQKKSRNRESLYQWKIIPIKYERRVCITLDQTYSSFTKKLVKASLFIIQYISKHKTSLKTKLNDFFLRSNLFQMCYIPQRTRGYLLDVPSSSVNWVYDRGAKTFFGKI